MRPSLDLLEERTLLNAAVPHHDGQRAVPAEVASAKHAVVPIVTNLPSTPNSRITTIPANGDVNPYGLAVVPAGFPKGGLIHAGEYLVSNFNNSTNTQGTGTTIVAITPGQNPATAPVFFSSQAAGLTESLEVLKSGFVIVGNVPTTDGTSATIGPGSIQIINRFGVVVQTLSDANTNSNLFDGPWASAVIDKGNTAQLFISDVESGAVTRINFKVVKNHGQSTLKVVSTTQIASGYSVTPGPVSAPPADVFVQTNLVSNGAVPAPDTDANLVGPWGLAFSTGGPFWVANQITDVSTIYSVSETQPPTATTLGLVVGIPNLGGAAANPNANGPTSLVSTGAPGITTNSTTDFQLNGAEASFIFANIDGSISAWDGTATATIVTSVANASFTGLAIANLPGAGGAAQLYAADQNSGNIDVFNSHFQMTGSFTQPAALPAGYAAFNVQNLTVNGTQTLFVTYADQSTGGGIVDEFSTSGTFIATVVNDTAGVNLDAPWGLAIAPAGWGQFGGDLLVANNNANAGGQTEINAYTLNGSNAAQFAGTVTLNNGQPFSETELWGISFGGGGKSGSPNTLFFTAGVHAGNADGLLGAISAVPGPVSTQPSSAAVIAGPGGLAYDSKNDTLYVAATGNNEIFAIKHASKTHSDNGTGTLVYQDQAHLRGPIGLALAPNGDLLTTNSDAVNADAAQPSELIEFTPQGQFVGELSLDPALGAAFQIVVQSKGKKVTIATVNDDLNTLDFRTITT
jgi:uncharacterized protein (TIGR03118 family)